MEYYTKKKLKGECYRTRAWCWCLWNG